MKRILFLFVITYLVLFISESVLVNEISKVYLLTHEWCRKCDKVIKIMQKVKLNLQKEESIKYQEQINIKIQMIHFYHDFHQQKNVTQSHSQKSEQNNYLKINDQNQLNSERIYKKIEDIHGLSKSEISFPTIWIQCPYYTGFYQNQLTYSEVFYWIKLYCKGQIPNCALKNINKQNQQEDYHFKISSKDFQVNHSQFISLQLKNPFTKFCLSSQNIKQKYSLSQLKLQLQQMPLFFSHFNHNLRNYLYQSSSKLAVFLIFNIPSHPKIKQFIDIYKFISDSFHKKNIINLNEGKISRIFESKQPHKIKLQSQYHYSSIKNYDFESKKHIYQNLVFVGACYNENKRQCIMKYEYNVELNKQKREKDPSEKPIIENYKIPFSFVGSKTQNLKRILEFSHVKNIFQKYDPKEQKIKNSIVQIIAFNFDKKSHQIEAHIFQNTAVKLGNDFLFWVQKVYLQIFEKEQQYKSVEDKQFMDSRCLSSQIIHYISARNFTVIKNNVKINKYLQKINQGQQRLIKFKTRMIEEEPQNNLFNIIVSKNRWKSQYFQICILNQPKKIIYSYEELMKILQQLKQLQKSKGFSMQIEMPTTNQL